jgi:hypothetical protein
VRAFYVSMRESTVERRFVRDIRRMGGRAIKISAVKDFPDRIALFPFNVHFFVELKRPGEKPTPPQKRYHYMLREMGHHVLVVDGTDWPAMLLLIRHWVTVLTARSAPTSRSSKYGAAEVRHHVSRRTAS